MPRASDLSETDDSYLTSQIQQYRATPATEKEAFRLACAKHVISQRGLDENEYMVDLFHGKVRNWFQNHAQKTKRARLPLRINQSFTPSRIFAMRNEQKIRTTVKELQDQAAGDGRARIVDWNDTVRQLWSELLADQQALYALAAKKCNEEGPEDDMKPLLAEKRGPLWMRAVADLFWSQCKMPVFIYGMYEDSKGELHATVYDTSNLWRESDKNTALFRNVPGWDKDFRRVAWNFFQAALRPDLSTPDTLDAVQASRRQPPPPFQFALHDDGCPVLVDEEYGKPLKNPRRQDAMREYVKRHYSLATGREARSAPWNALRDNTEQFFEPGMLPDGFIIQDPSHISEFDLHRFFTHVIDMENPKDPDIPPRRFRLSHYQTGPRDNPVYVAAVYNGVVEPYAPKRAKRTVAVPDWDGAPSTLDDSSSVGTRTTHSPQPDAARLATPLGATIDAVFEKARAEVLAERVGNAPPLREQSDAPGSAVDVPALPTRRGRRPAASRTPRTVGGTPWLDAEIDAGDLIESSDDDPEEDVYAPPEQGDDDEGSDDEVEEFLKEDLDFGDVSDGEPLPGIHAAAPERDRTTSGHTQGSSGRHGTSPPGSEPTQLTLPATLLLSQTKDTGATGTAEKPTLTPPDLTPMRAPKDTGGDPVARVAFLEELATDAEYVALLTRVADQLQPAITLRAQAPVFWGTWGHKSAHVPEAVITNEKKVEALLKWVGRERPADSEPAIVQRFCLVVGTILRDLTLIAKADATSIWPEEVPTYMATSQLEASHRKDVLTACASAFTRDGAALVPAGVTHKGKGKAAARSTKAPAPPAARAQVAPAVVPAGGMLPPDAAGPSRRTTRSGARRT
ncbi:hypothetical protein LXA43DRAFT_1062149 [Ganoderma leucocontextum]|nr:hypothetical protein LXA43DRAFT_1062149 [Ganoderma leucocontextum]